MSPPQFPPGRYGRRRERRTARRWVIVTLGAGAVTLTLALAGVAYVRQRSDVQASVTGFVVGGDSVRITFVLRRPADDDVVCVLRARDARGAEVGRARLRIPAGNSTVRTTYLLRTHGRPNTGEVYGCSAGSG